MNLNQITIAVFDVEQSIAFYENLKEGQSKDEALANAKRDFIQNNPMKNHPFYWAGFMAMGASK